MKIRELHTVILSDCHLGTYGLHAKELLQYLKQINPRILILNGDIVDIWAFRKRYFPDMHLEIIHEILRKVHNGTMVYYLPGNHDDLMRQFTEFRSGNIQIRDKLHLQIDGKDYWIFHGDVFDASVNTAKWLAKLGGKGYDWLIRINRFLNAVLKRMGKEPMSLSKKVKSNVKKALKFIDDFEQTAIDLAIKNDYDYVICSHIHTPTIKHISNQKGSVIYMNSGDWVESLTSLEYKDGEWSLYEYKPDHYEILNSFNITEEIKTFVE